MLITNKKPETNVTAVYSAENNIESFIDTVAFEITFRSYR